MFRQVRQLFSNLRIMATTSFEGASTTRRLRTWGTSSVGPNAAIQDSLATIRNRCHTLVRNNPTAFSGIDSFVTNLIGRGITPRWNTGDTGLDKELLELWKLSAEEIDADGGLNFYGMQALATRAMLEAGDVLALFKYRRHTGDLLVPLQIQLLEADHLNDSYDLTLSNGNTVRLGVELNPSGRRVAYHLYKEHPGDNNLFLTNTLLTIRIPARSLLHVFEPFRPGQLRGWPRMGTIITRLYNLDQYEDAELDRKKTAAFYAMFITTPSGDPVISGLPGQNLDYNDEDYLVGLEPGIIQALRPGQVPEFSKPADVGETYEPWIKQQYYRIASGMGITYEQLTGDLRGVNYSSIRAGLVEFYRACRMKQAHIIVYKFCRPVTTRWLDTAVLAKTIKITNYIDRRRRIINNIWDGDGWDWVDPLKDVKGKQLSVRCGFESRARVVSESGGNIAEIDQELAADNARADKNELILDSDPRYTTGSGGSRESNSHNPMSEEAQGGIENE